MVILSILLLPKVQSHYHSPSADATSTINVNSLFRHTASRNQRIITQALDIVVSMQTAPTCTQMAASHLMNECKLLEHAPEFTKTRPEAYLDNVKTEYAAKLAVCELLSAQPLNSIAPPHCDVLVPAARHCNKGGGWWHARPAAIPGDKQCYPQFKEHQYMQCLKSLQSTPQYWTSFSNARQNAVVMCQASRDAIERENHLEVFKNLTQIVGDVNANMQKTTENYESLIHEQRRYAEEARGSHQELKKDLQAVRTNAVATVEAIDNKFHKFIESSVSDFIKALATSQSDEMNRIVERMQRFSQDLTAESSQLAKYFSDQLQQYHGDALESLRINHEAQVHSYEVLSSYMSAAQDAMNKTNDAAGRSLVQVDRIAQRLDAFESQAEHIIEGFAFLSAIPGLAKLLICRFIATIGVISIFATICKLDMRLAIYIAGACSSAFLLHTTGILDWLTTLHSILSNEPLAIIGNIISWQKGTGTLLLLWLGAYPICRINAYLGNLAIIACRQLLSPLWVSEYRSDAGMGYLPSVEVPAAGAVRREDDKDIRSLHRYN
ncbi:hypothetical protein yc1106_08983 [Curvularia clavata]|uniref:Nuclear fusion protein KAR5 n=1 Tax=Curvularia clavata TaxID=95742 RepID=A0A9Q8ZHR7_CURCL|nr:hypothetical protein yc1106_08983 [Curvularia clavata]